MDIQKIKDALNEIPKEYMVSISLEINRHSDWLGTQQEPAFIWQSYISKGFTLGKLSDDFATPEEALNFIQEEIKKNA